MSTLEDLHKSIANMSDEELYETLRLSRLSRRTSRKKPDSTKKRTTAVMTKKAITLPPASTFSQERAAEMLKQLAKKGVKI